MLKSFISIYEPVTIELDGVKYPIKKLNRARFREFIELQKQADAAPPEERVDYGYRQIAVFVNAPGEITDDLDFKQVLKLTAWLIGYISSSGEKEEDPEKNGPRPGDETPPA
jgi:hypothetical protein